MSIQNQELQALQDMVGAQAVLTAEEDIRPHAVDWRRYYNGRPLAVVKPASTAEVAAVMRWCAAQRVAVVPQGGNTGMAGGGTPHEDGRETYGHSLVVDPWVEVAYDGGESSSLGYALIDPARTDDVRGQLPSLANKREIPRSAA